VTNWVDSVKGRKTEKDSMGMVEHYCKGCKRDGEGAGGDVAVPAGKQPHIRRGRSVAPRVNRAANGMTRRRATFASTAAHALLRYVFYRTALSRTRENARKQCALLEACTYRAGRITSLHST